MKPKILVTGGDGRFAKTLKRKNKKLNLIFKSKDDLNILKVNSLEKYQTPSQKLFYTQQVYQDQ